MSRSSEKARQLEMDSRIPKIRIPGGRESKGVVFLEPRLWDLFIQDELDCGSWRHRAVR